MSALGSQQNGRRAISATEEEVLALLDRLDAQESESGEAKPDKDADRFEYRVDSCEVTLQHIGATNEVRFVVPTRNMSATGMTFLHSGFVHTTAKCKMALVTNNGSAANVDAVVSGCRYVENWMHEVSVEFKAKIHAASFCPPSPEWTALVVVADADELRQVRHYLTVLRAEVQRAGNGAEITAKANDGKFDSVFVELDRTGTDVIKEVRGNGYDGVIIGVVNEGDASKVDDAVSAGCTVCLCKPYSPELFKAVYEAVRGPAPAG